MGMDVTATSTNAVGYGSSAVDNSTSPAKAAKAEDKKGSRAAKEEEKKGGQAAKEEEKKAESAGVVYEKSQDSEKKATYSVNKMSAEDRAALVKQLQAEQNNRKQSLVNLVQSMMGKQANAYAKAGGDESMWRFLASGKYTVDAATKAQAQQDISENGYWGVKQTSQRLFDFASALAGDDVEKMKEMQAAMEKGFKKAEKTWGGSLPGICQETITAANKLFDDYYASKASA